MKHFLFISLLSVFLFPVDNGFVNPVKPAATPVVAPVIENKHNVLNLGSQELPGFARMRSIIFKSQEFCRAEADNEFDFHFAIVSAKVYFSGTNFKNIEVVEIKGPSLKVLQPQMARCVPGTIVVFDDIKVMGPDKFLRTIQGLSLTLY